MTESEHPIAHSRAVAAPVVVLENGRGVRLHDGHAEFSFEGTGPIRHLICAQPPDSGAASTSSLKEGLS